MQLITSEKQSLLHNIKYFYGLNESSVELLSAYFTLEETNKIWDLQQALAEYIFCDKILVSFQPYRKYRRTFLKTIIEIIENLSGEVNETVLEEYIKLINTSPSTDEEKYFLVIFAKEKLVDSEPIIIEQFASIISNGTTGLHVWPACYQLVDFMKNNISIFKEKIILELGCGLGLLGLNCLKVCMPKEYVFTDSHEKVLAQLRTNIDYNHPDGSNADKIKVESLDWTEFGECNLFTDDKTTHFDFILASDIIFDPDLMPALADTLDFIWKNNSNKDLIFYISSTIRNDVTYKAFLRNLGAKEFKHDCVESSTCSLKNSCNSTPNSTVELLKIYK